ncbi:MAG TPA: hypothetical protein DEH78_25310, partial [Solibacterales bacterium]|nr:hypothetical protein [Bryobacterales bacterium]
MTTMRFWAAAALALGGALAQPEPKPAPAPTPKAMPGMPGMPGPAPRPMAFLEGSLEALQAELEAKQGVLGRTIIPEEAMLAEMEARLAASQARIASAGVQLTGLAPMAALAGVEANLAMAMAQAAPASPRAAGAGSGSTIAAAEMARAARDRDRKERAYRDGRSRLDRRQYAEAVQAFDEVIAGGGNRKEGALYWKAYALTRLGRSDEALASLKDIPSESRWAGDAKALEVEARQASGRPVSPENQQDEELKLFALNALVSSDPDRVMPILDRLLKSSSSPRMKERALFVLAQMESAKARDTLLQVARGGGNPDLQLK